MSVNDFENIKVGFTAESIFIEDTQGTKHLPLMWFPILMKASSIQREKYSLSPFGIHWEELNEDLSFEGFYTYKQK